MHYYALPYVESSNVAFNSKKVEKYLKVALPHFSTQQNTKAILYTAENLEQARYIKSEWKESLPVLLQEWLLQAIGKLNRYKGVMRLTSRAKVRSLLESDIIKFHHLVKQKKVEVSLRLTLLDYNSRKVIKHGVFNYQQAVDNMSAQSAVKAFNHVLKDFNSDLSQWLSE